MVGLRYENVHIHANVEVLFEGVIFPGKVRWKGKISGRQGNWVGLELCTRIGTGNGCQKGIQYFTCPDGYGVFVKSSQLRFPPSKGRSYSSYQRISKESFIDEELFGHKRRVTSNTDFPKSCYISSLYAANSRKCFPERQSMNERRNYHLGHPIGCRSDLYLYNKRGPFSGPGPNSKGDLFVTKEEDKSIRTRSTGLLAHSYANYSPNGRSRRLISPPSIPCIHKLTSSVWI